MPECLMIRNLLLGLLGLSASACVVLPVGAVPSSASSHPHGGPPGQMKKDGHHSHHKKCGHKHKKHKGSDVYFIDGRWMTVDGIVVIVD